jgi:nicotinamide mononucleotide transporter
MMAQWMISQKRIENWLLWVFADVIMTILCISQGLWFTAFQYAVFTGIALAGFFEWRKKLEV